MKNATNVFIGIIILSVFFTAGKIIMHRKAPNKELQKIFDDATLKYGLPKNLLRNIAWTESRYNSKAVSPVGARGIMQFMPATAAEYRVNVNDVKSSVDGAARYMVWLYGQLRDWNLAIAAYNGGIGRLKRNKLVIAAMSLETRDYVKRVSEGMA